MTYDARLLMMLTELALHAGEVPHEAASRVPRPRSGGTISVSIEADGFALIGLDLILTSSGTIVLCECNGSNMAATSFGGADGDTARATHQLEAAVPRLKAATRGVVLIAYAAHTGAIAEIMARAALICAGIQEMKPCALIDASHAVGGDISVVVDSVENIAVHIAMEGDRMLYQGVEVVSVANPNLLPELVRRGTARRDGAHYCVDDSLFHDGRFVDLVHDKSSQQRLAEGTGITPLAWRDCDDMAQCIAAIGDFQAQGLAVVAKMNGGSGGCGIEFFEVEDDSAAIAEKLARLESDARHDLADIKQLRIPFPSFQLRGDGGGIARRHHVGDVRTMGYIKDIRGIARPKLCEKLC